MRRILCLVLSLCALAFVGCAAQAPAPDAAMTDDAGRAYSVESPERVAVCSGSLAGIWQLAGGNGILLLGLL